MNKNEEIEKLKQALMEKIKSEGDSHYTNLSSDEVMKIIIDTSNNGKYIFWVIREYLKSNIQRFEDMGRVKQALILFKKNLYRFDNSQKQLNRISFQELESLVKPYQEVLTQNAIKRMNKEKIWSEIDVIYEGVEGRIYVPRTEQASIFLGQGTKWCTGAVNKNMFERYNKKGPLYVFVTNKKDKNGCEEKYQLHFESEQFMNSEDKSFDFENNNALKNLLNIIFESLSSYQKLYLFSTDTMFFKIFHKNKFFEEFYEILLPYALENSIFSYRFGKKTIFKFILEQYKTEDFLNFCLTKDPFLLELMPEEFKTKEICENMVKKYGRVLRCVPENFITYELCKKAVENDGSALTYVPENMKTKEICRIAVNKSAYALAFVPKQLMSKKLVYESVKNNDDYSYLSSLNTEFFNVYFTEATFKLLLKKSIINFCLTTSDNFSKKFLTKKMFIFALKEARNQKKKLYNLFNSKNTKTINFFQEYLKDENFSNKCFGVSDDVFAFLPDELKSEALCKDVISRDGSLLKYVPEKLKTLELCEMAVKQNAKLLHFVPIENDALYEIALAKGDNILFLIPDEKKTYELCKLAVEKNGQNLTSIPDDLISHEFYKLALKSGKINLETIKKEHLTNDFFLEIVNLKAKKHGLKPYNSYEEAIENIYNSEFKNTFHEIFGSSKQFYFKKYIEMKINSEFCEIISDNVQANFT